MCQKLLTLVFLPISGKNFRKSFPQGFSCIFAELDPDWLAPHHPIPNAKFPPITALLNMPTYHKSAKIFPQEFPTRFSCKNFPQDFPARFSYKNFLQEFPTRFFHKNFLQDFPTRFSCKNFPQDFPARISRNIFPQDFLTRISCKNFQQEFPAFLLSWILIGWLPITLFQMLNFHQSLLC